jgi:hypothetical protein
MAAHRIALCILAFASAVLPETTPAQSERFGGSSRPTTPTQTPLVRPPQPAVRSQPTFSEQLNQLERQPATNVKTLVEITVLLPRLGAAVEAQRWARIFSDLGVEAKFHSPLGTEELGVEEKLRGTFRTVKVTGQLADDGRLQLGGSVYTNDNLRPLKEWLATLTTYGAQGSPQGQPLWGLNEAQFTSIYEALSQPVEKELEGLTLADALRELPLPAQYPVRNLNSADQWLATHKPAPIENRVQGLSCGTALATILSETGLGFYPSRTPDGRIELQVEPRTPGKQVWPVGWDLPEGVDHGMLVPVLHKFLEIGFDDAALQDVLDAAAAAIEVPILIDYEATRAANVDLAKQTVSYAPKRTTWALMLNSIIRKANLIKEIRMDEAGKAFLFVAPFVPTPVEK